MEKFRVTFASGESVDVEAQTRDQAKAKAKAGARVAHAITRDGDKGDPRCKVLKVEDAADLEAAGARA